MIATFSRQGKYNIQGTLRHILGNYKECKEKSQKFSNIIDPNICLGNPSKAETKLRIPFFQHKHSHIKEGPEKEF